jgi:alpha-L-fucosidase
VPREEYVKLAEQWNPVKFDPDAVARPGREAGMRYICLTTKHHDGFCLWDTKLTDFNTMNTPYGRDIVGMLAEACHKRASPVPVLLVRRLAPPELPQRGPAPRTAAPAGRQPDLMKYLEFLRGQVRELCTNYGEIHGFWWDMNVPKHVDPSINAMIRELQPKA